MRILFVPLAFVLAAVIPGLTSCASRGVATRPVVDARFDGGRQPDPQPHIDPSQRWYLEAPAVKGGKPYSCSFIEFDDRGDYLDFPQHRHAYEKIQSMAQSGERVAVVIFLHGWRNSSQSGNVPGFLSFLKQIAESDYVKESGLRVHGVYLGWRGGIYKPSPVSAQAMEATGLKGNIVDPDAGSPVPKLTNFLETLSYKTDKSLPEYKLSGTAISRTIYTCAHTAKHHGAKDRNRVFVIAHSFGALLLERTFMNATLGELIKERANPKADPNPLPLDTVLLVNSAAPSIYAKLFQGYLAAHRQAMYRNGVRGADAPVFISITSETDTATGMRHPMGNMFAGLSPTLQRDYRGYADFILWNQGQKEPMIPQAEYYKRTPGHNPLLVNRWVEPCPDAHVLPMGPISCVDQNLDLRVSRDEAMRFLTTGNDGTTFDQWEIRLAPDISEANAAWSMWQGYRPVCWNRGPAGPNQMAKDRGQSGYWIMRCPSQIISHHNDIWNQRAMETYAALFRLADVMSR